MHKHTCLSLRECWWHTLPLFHIFAAEWHTKNHLLHVYAFSPMWHPCWIACWLQHRKNRELWNTRSSALYWKCAPNSTEHIHYWWETGQKADRSVRHLFCQAFHKITGKTTVCLLLRCFSSDFFQQVLPPALFLLWSQSGTRGPASFWQATRTGITYFCLLVPAPLVAAPISQLLLFSFSDLILSLAKD